MMILGILLCGFIEAMTMVSAQANSTYYLLPDEPKALIASYKSDLTTPLQLNSSTLSSIQANNLLILRCSSEAWRAKAVGFATEDGTCSLLNPGSAIMSDVAFYQLIVFPTNDILEEVARNKPATGATPFSSSYRPGKAVDGVPLSMYISSLAVRPWWQVDLLEEKRIYQIQIYPRQQFYIRFHNVEVRIGTTYVGSGNLSSYRLLCSYTKTYTLLEGYLLCSRYEGVVGRYISVQITAAVSEFLQIIEVNIFAFNTSALIP